jgi:hypothetical protein
MPEIEILVANYSYLLAFLFIQSKNLKMLPLKSQYIFPLLLWVFVGKSRDLYESNSEIHNINTRFSSDLLTPSENLTTFQKGPFYFGIKVFYHLPTSIKNTSHDINQFRTVDVSNVTYVTEWMNK